MRRLVEWLLPAAVREEVLGDLEERSRVTGRYWGDLLLVWPAVLASRVRRTADPAQTALVGLLAYACCLAQAWWMPASVLMLVWPPLVSLFALVLADAYATTRRPVRAPLAAWCWASPCWWLCGTWSAALAALSFAIAVRLLLSATPPTWKKG